MSRPDRAPRTKRRRIARGSLALLALGLSAAPQFGCGREYFRHWADQDVAEAVFEKSRDPRWALDSFTIEPPSLSRFADPYDVDRPPAPPDDAATEALTTTAQLPYHRLLVPNEGTGYLDIMKKGPRYVSPPPPPQPVTPAPAPPVEPEPVLPQQPGDDAGNSGTKPGDSSPNPLPALPDAGRDRPAGTPPQARNRTKDSGVLLTTFQAPGAPPVGADPAPGPAQVPGTPAVTPTPNPAAAPAADPSQAVPNRTPKEELDAPGSRRNTGPRSPVDPLLPGSGTADPTAPGVALPNLTPEERRRARAGSASFSPLRGTGSLVIDEAQIAGYSSESRPFIVNPALALQLALQNNRGYQFNLENVYIQALAVTLARFGFQPQFYAGNSPPGTGFSPRPGIQQNFLNSYTYRTKETIGGQASALNYGTAAGVGKVFSFGGGIVAGFANQTIFNFNGNKPSQPSVASYLPLSFAQPFLAGGGRAVTLENLTQQERTLVYAIRQFARYRQDMVPAILTFNTPFDINSGPSADPTPGYLQILINIQSVENDRRTVAGYDRLLSLFKQYVRGSASSGISQIQVDQVANSFQSQRGRLVTDEATLRGNLDAFKIELGLPTDTPMILDRSVTSGFQNVFNDLDKWADRDDHEQDELYSIVGNLPKLESIVLDGRKLFRYDETGALAQVYADPDKLQEFLITAERIAFENRLDLMNSRAQLFDFWRQIAVTANGLLGVFNVQVTNNITTPSTTSNPFAFSDQAKQFSLVLNTELPLVRVSQRNAYRTAQINFRRQQRLLMSVEDDIKQTVRQDVYQIINFAENYEINKTNLLIAIRQRDNSQQQIIAPPTSIDAGANAASQATQTLNLISGINNVLNFQNSLLQQWVQFQAERLQLYRDTGLLPIDEWEAFYEFFPSGTGSGNPSSGGGNGGQPAAGGAANPS